MPASMENSLRRLPDSSKTSSGAVKTRRKTSPLRGSLPARCFSTSHMEQDGTGDGSCAHQPSLSRSAWASSSTSSLLLLMLFLVVAAGGVREHGLEVAIDHLDRIPLPRGHDDDWRDFDSGVWPYHLPVVVQGLEWIHLGGEHQRAGGTDGDTVRVHIQHTGVAHLI